MESGHKLWYHRGTLPHFDAAKTLQCITYRLADSLPQATLAQYQRHLNSIPPSLRQRTLRLWIEQFVDAGHGSCLLREAVVAQAVLDTWMEDDGRFYDCLEWVIMPNHVHLLIRQYPGSSLHRLVRRWKSRSAQRINRSLGRSGPLWMKDFWDRYIRDQQHYLRACHYIRHNPVSARLVSDATHWPWSSASALPAGAARPERGLLGPQAGTGGGGGESG